MAPTPCLQRPDPFCFWQFLTYFFKPNLTQLYPVYPDIPSLCVCTHRWHGPTKTHLCRRENVPANSHCRTWQGGQAKNHPSDMARWPSQKPPMPTWHDMTRQANVITWHDLYHFISFHPLPSGCIQVCVWGVFYIPTWCHWPQAQESGLTDPTLTHFLQPRCLPQMFDWFWQCSASFLAKFSTLFPYFLPQMTLFSLY